MAVTGKNSIWPIRAMMLFAFAAGATDDAGLSRMSSAVTIVDSEPGRICIQMRLTIRSNMAPNSRKIIALTDSGHENTVGVGIIRRENRANAATRMAMAAIAAKVLSLLREPSPSGSWTLKRILSARDD